jgi:hypothetical protein
MTLLARTAGDDLRAAPHREVVGDRLEEHLKVAASDTTR